MNRIIVLVVSATVTLGAPVSRADDPLILAGEEVDLQLILAADISGSMSGSLRNARRQGFAAAFHEPALQRAVTSGLLGKIAVTYFEWAGQWDQRVIVPWTILSEPKHMIRFAETLETSTEKGHGGETSISGAMMFAQKLFEESGVKSFRKVVDISGNGRNSQGPEIAMASGLLRASGATINGLVLPEPDLGPVYVALFGRYDGPLVDYYRSEVIGGPGAFAIEVTPERGFGNAILRKLVLEVAWLEPAGSQ